MYHISSRNSFIQLKGILGLSLCSQQYKYNKSICQIQMLKFPHCYVFFIPLFLFPLRHVYVWVFEEKKMLRNKMFDRGFSYSYACEVNRLVI